MKNGNGITMNEEWKWDYYESPNKVDIIQSIQ